ncbi:MAG: hypothetical protein AAB923_04030, partial [Patescibacteria group bacterium]
MDEGPPIDKNFADVSDPRWVRILELSTGLAFNQGHRQRQQRLENSARLRADRRETFWGLVVSTFRANSAGEDPDVFGRTAA